MSDFDEINWDNEEDTPEVALPPQFGVTPPPAVVVPPADVVAFEDVATDANTATSQLLSVASTGEGEHMTVVQVDSYGNETTTVIDMALPPLDETEARELTDKIKGTTNLLYLLIKRAHAGKAYKALGYSSFEAYVREEFNYSRSYAYRLLHQSSVIEAIEAVAPEGTEVYVGELTARGLKSALPELLEDIEERTADATPDEAKTIIEDAIRDVQNRKDEEDNFDEDFDSFEEGEYEGGNGGGNQSIEFIDDDDDELSEFLTDDDPVEVVKRLEGLWNLINGLQNFNELSENADVDELLPLIPEDRTQEITRLIDVNIQWLNTVKIKWDVFLADRPVSDTPEDDFNHSEDFGDGDIDF